MLLMLLTFPIMLIGLVSYIVYYGAVLKKEKNVAVAKKNVTITPQLKAGEIESLYYRQEIARFLFAHYGENMVQWQPDSWVDLSYRPSFTCKIFLANGLTEICKVWQKEKKPYQIKGVGASFHTPTEMVNEEEFETEKEKREFSLEVWLDNHTQEIMLLCMEARERNENYIVVPNEILPKSDECKKTVQKGLMSTSMFGISEVREAGLYFQLLDEE